jgi:hypothetical protein
LPQSSFFIVDRRTSLLAGLALIAEPAVAYSRANAPLMMASGRQEQHEPARVDRRHLGGEQ